MCKSQHRKYPTQSIFEIQIETIEEVITISRHQTEKHYASGRKSAFSSPSFSLSLSLSLALSLSLSLSLSISLFLSLFLSLFHSLSLSFSLSHTHSLSLSVSLSYTRISLPRYHLCFFLNFRNRCVPLASVIPLLLSSYEPSPECEPWSFGSGCAQYCFLNCKDKVCDHTDGVCTKGCNDGYFGNRCSRSNLRFKISVYLFRNIIMRMVIGVIVCFVQFDEYYAVSCVISLKRVEKNYSHEVFTLVLEIIPGEIF